MKNAKTIIYPLGVNNRIIFPRTFELLPDSVAGGVFWHFSPKPVDHFGFFISLGYFLVKNISFQKPIFQGSLKKEISLEKSNSIRNKICEFQAVIFQYMNVLRCAVS